MPTSITPQPIVAADLAARKPVERIAEPPPSLAASILYDLNLWSAFRAGLIGAVGMTVYMFMVPRLLGIPQMDIGITIGRLCDSSDSYGLAYWTGWTLWHVVNAVIYVVPFGLVVWIVRQISTRLFGVWWQVDVINGFLFGLVLLLLGPMTGVPSMLADLPEVTERGLTNPGFFMLGLGLGWLPALVDLGAHSLHGCLVGYFYKLRDVS
jgi:hypothetical protein